MTPLTCERPARGLVVYQPARGYRYAMDPFLLAGWVCEVEREGDVLDVGAGSGILGLLLAAAGHRVHAIEARPEWLPLIERSARESGVALGLRLADVRTFEVPEPYGLVVCNPPYFPRGRGKEPVDPVKAAARFEHQGTLAELVASMCRLGRRVALVVPAARASEAVQQLCQGGRPPGRRCDLGDQLVLLEGWSGADAAPTAREFVRLRVDGAHSPRVVDWYRTLGAELAPLARGNRLPHRDREDHEQG